MEYNAETPRTNAVIAGRTCSVIQPFAEGQPLTPATAAMLNQTLKENFSNNLREKINLGQVNDKGEPIGTPGSGKPGSDDYVAPSHPYTDEELSAIVEAYMTEYQPGVRTGGGARIADPVEREARELAKIEAVKLVKARGLKVKDVDLPAITDRLLETNREHFMKEGAKIVKVMEQSAKASEALNIGDVLIVPARSEDEEAAEEEEIIQAAE